mmetsp:Transcript_56467/g.104555  ORF Transcript_56467/g.104555 Transcript_56467/m.104555 type:complete len:290 (+) Transcript_56467:70-939(+)
MGDAELLRRFQPEEYYGQFLERDLRPDGRQMLERREAVMQVGIFSSAQGSASVRFGLSSAVAGVRAFVSEAVPDQPPVGRINISVDLPHLCHHSFRDRGKANAISTFLSRAFTDILNNHVVFDSSQLDIKGSETFWSLMVDVVCLNYDGNPFDVCLLAAVAALQNASLPTLVTKESLGAKLLAVEGEIPPDCQVATAARKISVQSRPAPTTFSQMHDSTWVLDPTAEEEELGSSLSLCLVGRRWLVYHQGSGAQADSFLKELMPAASAALPDLQKLFGAGGDASGMDCS